jgi:hypothetical protein
VTDKVGGMGAAGDCATRSGVVLGA